jgi:hypothetical protein
VNEYPLGSKPIPVSSYIEMEISELLTIMSNLGEIIGPGYENILRGEHDLRNPKYAEAVKKLLVKLDHDKKR